MGTDEPALTDTHRRRRIYAHAQQYRGKPVDGMCVAKDCDYRGEAHCHIGIEGSLFPRPGDWIVIEDGRAPRVYTAEAFAADFEELDRLAIPGAGR